MPDWNLNPGDKILRMELQAKFGGRTQGGIGPSKTSPNVLIFSDPGSGEQHGYVDGWQADGCFHYTGEGQYGDQQMKSGNRSIFDSVKEKRALRLFQGARGTVRYIDEFELATNQPYYHTDAPETGDGPTRSVIVFRMKPKTIAPQTPDTRFAGPLQGAFADSGTNGSLPVVTEVDIEEQWTEKVFVNPRQEQTVVQRREATLVLSFRDFLRAQGTIVTRLMIIPKGEVKPIFSDLYVSSSNLLVEAKGSVERGSIRMAIGQLLDYRRFARDGVRCAILVPSRPRDDLVEFVEECGVEFFWPEGKGFFHTGPVTSRSNQRTERPLLSGQR